jgi:Mrp family chromosome partitioning ATPase
MMPSRSSFPDPAGPTLRFDDSLPELVSGLLRFFPAGEVQRGLVFRDPSGRLAFIAPDPIPPDRRDEANQALCRRMGAYTRPEGRAVLDPDSPGADLILADPRRFRQTLELGDARVEVALLDRRIMGEDWLTAPAPVQDVPGRLVFASLKGGVGRTTCAAVLAVELSRLGRNVLAVDLDLEAPGLGAIMIADDKRPRYGALDWFVEAGLGLADDDLLDALVAPSRLRDGNGLIDVVPAVGQVSDAHPANVLAKLARAFLDKPRAEGEPESFSGSTSALLERLARRKRYDAILIDARAGLSEASAAPIQGLGADVLLFGVNTPQTFSANRYLLAHLTRFPRALEDDWLRRFKLVQAKASPDPEVQKAFRDRAFDDFDQLLYRDVPLEGDEGGASEGDAPPLTRREYSLTDPEAPHFAWVVLADSNYAEFDPLRDGHQLQQSYYQRTFGDFLSQAIDRLGLAEPE